ncbi:MAG TPA: metalloregulator ArsR/SmtB family transcription factor [Gemmatimonadaceae bacterium]
MSRIKMTPAMTTLVADRFKALAEPARLQILTCLRDGEMTVGELVEETGLGQANVSKHLQSLFAADFVQRRKEGLYTYYALADADVFRLCDLMCGRVERGMANRRKALSTS